MDDAARVGNVGTREAQASTARIILFFIRIRQTASPIPVRQASNSTMGGTHVGHEDRTDNTKELCSSFLSIPLRPDEYHDPSCN